MKFKTPPLKYHKWQCFEKKQHENLRHHENQKMKILKPPLIKTTPCQHSDPCPPPPCLSNNGNWPKAAFFALFLPFLPFSGGPEQHLGNPENGGKGPLPQISSDLLKPPSPKPPLAALPAKSSLNSVIDIERSCGRLRDGYFVNRC